MAQFLQSFAKLSQIVAKPRSLQVVNNVLYWLEGEKQTLWKVNLLDPHAAAVEVLEPKDRTQAMSKEEELLRERLRSQVTGISSFVIGKDEIILFQASGSLFVHSPRCLNVVDVFEGVTEHPFKGAVSVIQHGVDPTDITFVHLENIFAAKLEISENGGVLSVVTQVQRVTSIGKPKHECGTADYIMQEEFSRYTGHWSLGSLLLFTVSDTSLLKEVSTIDADGNPEAMPFPRVGDPNATVVIALYNFGTKSFSLLPDASIKACCPFVEYIPRIGFCDDKTIYFMALDRAQQVSHYCTVQVSDFVPIDGESELTLGSTAHTVASVPISVILAQDLPTAWIETTDIIHFSAKSMVVAMHESPATNFHLHKFDNTTNTWNPLTSGQWNVFHNGVTKLTHGKLFFIANKEEFLGRELHFVDVASGSITQVSPPSTHVYAYCSFHSNELGFGVAMVVSTADAPARLLVRIQNESGDWNDRIVATRWGLDEAVVAACVQPEVFSVGRTAHIALFSGRVSPAEKKPLMLYVYGGPHVQLVHKNNFDQKCSPLIQSLVAAGFAVAIVDNRMTNANSMKEQAACKWKMGTFETSDYVAAVDAICERFSFVDKSRVGIFGWSYGGYATLLAMCQAPTVFRVGFAGAPVGDWRLYDTGYTERYMGTLPEHVADYERGSVATYAAGFPNEINRVHIAHGLRDENVHFVHTCAIVNAMIKCDKPYTMQVYPGERHGLRQNPVSRRHYESNLVRTASELLSAKPSAQ